MHQPTPGPAPLAGQMPTPTVSSRPTPTLQKKPSPLQSLDENANSGSPLYGTEAQKEAIKQYSDKYTNVCHYCDKRGHWKSECPKNPKNVRKNGYGGAYHHSFVPPQVSQTM